MKRVAGIGLILLVLLSGIFVFEYSKFNHGKFHLVFCDVGQGDAIFIRTPKGSDILIDGGPDDSVLSCLAGHMPFWDRDLELVILTHPHADHLNGLISVSKRYRIISFATENLKNRSRGFSALMEILEKQNIKISYIYAGDRFVLRDGVTIEIVGPSKEFIQKTSPDGFIGERREFASVESLVEYKNFVVLLTGDSQAVELKEAIFEGLLKDIDALHVPHHGSKTGLSSEILDFVKPELAIISVDSNNRYGHPDKSIHEMLRNKGIKILRTDRDGEIEILSDGASWGVKRFNFFH